MRELYDAIIIGAGPSGLVAGLILKESSINYLIIEKGKEPYNRCLLDEEDVPAGVGGGGLFSDGKLSLSPAGSWMWKNLEASSIKKSYDIMRKIICDCGINLPEFEEKWTLISSVEEGEKNYPTIIINKYEQISLLNKLFTANKENIKANCSVTSVEKKEEYFIVTTNNNVYYCKNLILASGKYGYKYIVTDKIGKNIERYSKIEMGIRFECQSKSFKNYTQHQIDYKYIHKICGQDEVRTFCCAKDGKSVKSKFNDFISYNGSKTEYPTDRTSIGIVIRSENNNSDLYLEMEDCLKKKKYFFELSADTFFKSNKEYIGEKCDIVLKNTINNVIISKDADLKLAKIYGPEIEYTGEYILVNNNLNADDNLWVVGDATGKFRGLISAMISGIYGSLEMIKEARNYINKNVNQLGINVSNSDPLNLIFTAQSKRYFYCRDVVCEYVLGKGKLPINPFRVFDYFLSDRVDRDKIRRGNNQLINTCQELWVFGPIADGVLFEIALAKSNGKKIRFFTIGTKCSEIKEIVDFSQITFEPEVHSKQIRKSDLINFILNKVEDDGQLNFDDLW